ncbi:MAG: HAMP domain-containing sensor histidine kinase [Chloroflexota bacterium]|nr:HAMP domain-containing sensor histidine kinase [Chloroflexota bacterium]
MLLSYVVVILACLLVAALGLLVALRVGQIQQRIVFQRLRDVARVTTVAARGREVAPERLVPWLRQVDQGEKVRVLFLDPQGNVSLDSRREWEGQNLLAEASADRGPDGGLQGSFTDAGGQTWLFVALPWPAPPAPEMLVFAAPQPRGAALAWARDNLLSPLLWAGLAALVLSILLALLVSHSVAAPLRRVASAAEEIARGKIGTRAPVSGPAEVQSLAHSFNTMADQVESAQRSQRDFVANVSHELKTPLTSIQGFSQALLDGTAATPEATARAARIVHDEAERMRRMVDELLALARFDAGQVVMARDPVELGPLLQGCVEKLSPQARAAGVTIKSDVFASLFVTGDGDRLAQVFTNLLDNALAHTPAGARITLAAQPTEDGRDVTVAVTDAGEGIPAEALPRVFERFYQADKSRKRARGAGLGLAITKEIVEAHGGTITAESVVGLGTRFTVRLPVGRVGKFC